MSDHTQNNQNSTPQSNTQTPSIADRFRQAVAVRLADDSPPVIVAMDAAHSGHAVNIGQQVGGVNEKYPGQQNLVNTINVLKKPDGTDVTLKDLADMPLTIETQCAALRLRHSGRKSLFPGRYAHEFFGYDKTPQQQDDWNRQALPTAGELHANDRLDATAATHTAGPFAGTSGGSRLSWGPRNPRGNTATRGGAPRNIFGRGRYRGQ